MFFTGQLIFPLMNCLSPKSSSSMPEEEFINIQTNGDDAGIGTKNVKYAPDLYLKSGNIYI